MTLDDVLAEWDKDAPHDRHNLGNEALNISILHAKWLRILVFERLRLKKIESETKQLKLDKHEFYTQGPTKETQAKGWNFPARGVILNKDVHLYSDADPQIIEANLKVAYQAETVAACELIFKSIQNRNWEIGRAIEDIKFKQGG